jgi:signal transduction histidine kinase
MGTGLGLYISKMIIEKNMNGTLSVENDKHGATFSITMEKVDA